MDGAGWWTREAAFTSREIRGTGTRFAERARTIHCAWMASTRRLRMNLSRGHTFRARTRKTGSREKASLTLWAVTTDMHQSDKYSLIRSMTHGIFAHETASYAVQTGRKPGERLVYPCAGAVVSLFKGEAASGLIPPYIVITQPQGRFSENGFLGERYRPFATGGDPAQARFAVEGVVAQGISDKRQRDRRELLHQLNTLGKALDRKSVLSAKR